MKNNVFDKPNAMEPAPIAEARKGRNKSDSFWYVFLVVLLSSASLLTSCSSDEELIQDERPEEPEVEYLFSLNDGWDDAASSAPQALPEQCTLTLTGSGSRPAEAAEKLSEQPYFLSETHDSKSVLMGNIVPQGGKKRGRLVHASTFHNTFMLWSTGQVFDKTKMSNIEGTQRYSPNKRVAWGDNTQTTIYGIAPYSEDAYEDMSVEDGTFTYTTPSVATEQDDVMVSQVDAQATDKMITFPFTHALSAIRFKVGDKGIEYATELVRITISGIYTKGTYSFETGEWIGTDTGSITQDFKDVKDWEIGQLFTDDEKGTTFFVLPQTTPAEAKIRITLIDEVFGEYTLTSKIGGKTWTKGHAKAYKVSKVFDYGELFAAGAVPYMYDNNGGSGTMYVCSSRYKQNGGWSNVIGPLKRARWEYELSSTNYFQTTSTDLPSWITMEKLGGGGGVWNFDSMDAIEWETFNITVAPNPNGGSRYCQICLRQPGSNNRIYFVIFQGTGMTPTTNLKECVTFISGLGNECVGNGNIMLGTGNFIFDGYGCIINGNNNKIGQASNLMQPPQRQYDNYYTYIWGDNNEAMGSYAGITGQNNLAWGDYSVCGSRPSGNWYIDPWPKQ